MRLGYSNRRSNALTLTEVLVVLVVGAVLIVLLLPALTPRHRSPRRSECNQNLKQIGYAFAVWEGDHNDKYPMAVSTSAWGSMEQIYSAQNGATAGYGLTNVFDVMSNELNNARILACPADTSPSGDGTAKSVSAAQSFSAFADKNLSYFVEGDATHKYPKMVLAGDRNIGGGTAVAGGAYNTPATAMNMTSALGGSAGGGYCNNVTSATPGLNAPHQRKLPWAWTDADLHQDVGNLLMVDGSIQTTPISSLMAAVTNTIAARPPGTPASFNTIIVNMP